METITIIEFTTLAIAGLVYGFAKNTTFHDFAKLIFLFATTFFVIGQAEGDTHLFFGLISLAAFNFILSRFDRFKNSMMSTIPIVLSLVTFIGIYYGSVITIGESSYFVFNKFSITGIFIISFGHFFIQLKGAALSKFFGIESGTFEKSIHIFLIGFALYLASFGAGAIGVLLITGMYFISNVYRPSSQLSGLSFLIGLTLISLLISRETNFSLDILSGDVLLGVLIGIFGVVFLDSSIGLSKFKILLSIVGVFIIVVIACVLIVLSSMHAGMGGMDAFIGLMFGIVIASLLFQLEIALMGLLFLLFVLGSLLPSHFVNNELLAFEKEMNENMGSDSKANQPEIEYATFNGLEGNYLVLADSSNVSFTLGKKGETKGAFKKIEGSVNLNEKLELSSFRINLKMAEFTTFNKFRDESLFSDEYFNAAKFPTMSFESKSIQMVDSLNYVIDGVFQMLGKKQPQTVTLQRIKLDGQLWIVGEGKIDRTKFGMTPSATEGNVVTFQYKALLNQK